ncbi:hypothetical protein DFH07DRAFT_826698 [Mycena maculata]|uniref:Uncharacterized protein n=1 Tax=Mycena maculata TaxID=230809 RepID=A0AAD7IYT7_9AGAR|nr:hypothetical protein DFH07DRAFT_826698 [Mycena maculata]
MYLRPRQRASWALVCTLAVAFSPEDCPSPLIEKSLDTGKGTFDAITYGAFRSAQPRDSAVVRDPKRARDRTRCSVFFIRGGQ